MKIFKNDTIARLIIFLVALQIINMSIDAPAASMPRDLARNFNYIDTYVEYVAEVILKHENAIPETKNRQHKELQQHSHFTIILQNPEQPVASISFKRRTNQQRLDRNDKRAYQFIKEINPPPPKLL